MGSGSTPLLRHTEPHYLMIYIEPTPYILELVREVAKAAPHPVRMLFISENLSQSWALSVQESNTQMLPHSRYRAARQILAALAAGPKVLHLAGWGHPLLLFAMLAGALFRVAVTMESDTQLPFDPPRWKRAVKSVFYPLLFRLPSVFLPGGRRQSTFLRYYGVPKSRIVPANMTVDVAHIGKATVELGVHGRRLARRRFGFDDATVVVIYVGRLVPHKGVRGLLAAFEQARADVPNLALLIVGDGPERDPLEHAGKADPSIRLTGRLGQDGVVEALHTSDIAVLPSNFEPWGLVVNEAMAAGLPVIASDRVGAVDDLVRDGETGIVFPAGDIVALTRALRRLAEDRDLRERYGAAGRQLISGWTLRDSSRIILGTWAALSAEPTARETES